jgi:glycosyltransferase involved in cell wall biosynthesis
MKVVAFDADVLGRRRTGDETYARNLLRELGSLAHDAQIQLLAVTRHPELVPAGVEGVLLATRVQELRMAWSLPRLLRRVGADLVHTQYAVPLRCPCPAVVTVHDVSYAGGDDLIGRKDRFVFRRVVPRAVRGAARVLTVSERTKADLVRLYGLPAERIVVTPNGVDPAFHPTVAAAADNASDNLSLAPADRDRAEGVPSYNLLQGSYVLAVGAIQARKNQLAALAAAEAVGLPLVVAGPTKDASLAGELRRRGARLEGYVETERLADLYRGAACLVQASRFEGFGLPVLEAMASGTPVVAVPDLALREVAGDAALFVEDAELADGIRRALADRQRLVAAGLQRARAFTWRAAAERTLAVYREILGA